MKKIFRMIIVFSFLKSTSTFAYVDTETITPPTSSLGEEQTQNLATAARDAADKQIVVSKPVAEEKNCRVILKDVEVAKYSCEEDAYRTHVERLKSCPTNPTVRGASAHLSFVKVHASITYSDNCRPLAKARLGLDEANCKFLAAKTRATIGPCS